MSAAWSSSMGLTGVRLSPDGPQNDWALAVPATEQSLRYWHGVSSLARKLPDDLMGTA
jgi:hypothetical protein